MKIVGNMQVYIICQNNQLCFEILLELYIILKLSLMKAFFTV